MKGPSNGRLIGIYMACASSARDYVCALISRSISALPRVTATAGGPVEKR